MIIWRLITKWFVVQAQFLAFMFVVAVAITGTIVYENEQRDLLRAQVVNNDNFQIAQIKRIDTVLASPDAGGKTQTKIWHNADGSITLKQINTRTVTIPANPKKLTVP